MMAAQTATNETFQGLGRKFTDFFNSFKKKKETAPINIVMTRKQAMTSMGIAAITLLIMLGYGYMTYQKKLAIDAQSYMLTNLNNYDLVIDHDLLKSYGTQFETLNHLLTVEEEVSRTLNNYLTLASEQVKYYNMFLRHIYLPSLNLWKDPFTQAIDPTIMGLKYLESDPFQDIPLIQYRSDFFRNVWEGVEFNEITSIKVGEISDVDGEHFIVPVDISFSSPDKRSFLLLVNKLSMTSNANNVSLLNEFFFYLIKNIKELKSDEILQLREKYQALFSGEVEERDDDTIIGYHLYQWIKKDWENVLIDDQLLDVTIRDNILCDETRKDTECFYSFREKYRDIPYLAYTIGLLWHEGKTNSFEDFLKNLSPIITVLSFTFEKVKSSDIFSDASQVYQGSITLNAYGRSMSSSDVGEISDTLGGLCFGEEDGRPLQQITPQVGLQRIEDSILQLGSSLQLSNIINDLEELLQIFIAIQNQYSSLSHYQQSIKLFEIFRMLKDANLCTI